MRWSPLKYCTYPRSSDRNSKRWRTSSTPGYIQVRPPCSNFLVGFFHNQRFQSSFIWRSGALTPAVPTMPPAAGAVPSRPSSTVASASSHAPTAPTPAVLIFASTSLKKAPIFKTCGLFFLCICIRVCIVRGQAAVSPGVPRLPTNTPVSATKPPLFSAASVINLHELFHAPIAKNPGTFCI